MNIPLHPSVVHFPIVLGFILPILALVFAFMIKKGKMQMSSWLIIVALSVLTVGMGYLSLETGENEEDRVEKVVDKVHIQKHEQYAEIFVGVAVVGMVISVLAFFLNVNLQFPIQLLTVLVLSVAAFFAYKAGSLGGELVYGHGAARAYSGENSESQNKESTQQGILPTPGMNTSESPMPVNEENESLKVDDNDYGNEGDDVDESDVEKAED